MLTYERDRSLVECIPGEHERVVEATPGGRSIEEVMQDGQFVPIDVGDVRQQFGAT